MELFFLTDKSMEEAVYYWGNPINNDIFDLMLQFIYLELSGCFRLYSIWVAGTRQIVAGIYGFSGGCFTDRIASSGYILDFVPLNDTAFDSLTSLLLWVQTWIGVSNTELLTPECWFE